MTEYSRDKPTGQTVDLSASAAATGAKNMKGQG